jgi:hypothetical protein
MALTDFQSSLHLALLYLAPQFAQIIRQLSLLHSKTPLRMQSLWATQTQ